MYWSALILGFLGSMHCVIMCGPISMAMPGQNTLSRFLTSRVIYNLGRVITYALMGLAFGLLGEMIGLSGYQQSFSVVLGAFMILLAFAFGAQWINSKLASHVSNLTNVLKKGLKKWIQKSSLPSSIFLGMINGLLPCGLVYAAIAGALATSTLSTSVIYMVAFGLGTFPAMLLVALSGKFIKPVWLLKLSKFSSIAVFTLGIMLIVRGLNLDIPYLSPAISFLYPSQDITICN